MVTTRLAAAIKVLFASSAHVSFQPRKGADVRSIGFGHGDIKDLVLMARSMKESYDGFMDAVQQMATETGELHALQEIRDALDTLDGGN